MKVYVDDTRAAPETWILCDGLHSATEFILENFADITHIDFDYYLSEKNPYHTGMALLEELVYEQKCGKKIFHQPLENYTFHSSDASMNEKMRDFLIKEVFVGQKKKAELTKVSKLQRMRNSKGRR